MEDESGTRRSQQVRAQHRKVLAWSLAVAAVLHVAFFVLTPTFETDPADGWTARDSFPSPDSVSDPGVARFVQISFGPPEILAHDGAVHREPDDRELEVGRLIRLPDECLDGIRRDRPLPAGRVHVLLDDQGRVVRTAIEEPSGDACGDEVILMVTDLLWYHWLPNEHHPAPVELIQPVALLESERPDSRRR